MPSPRVVIRWTLILLAAAAILALPLLAPPDGRDRAALAQFAGRFHPLLVHLPIALIALVPLMELAGQFRRWSHLRLAAGFVLVLAAFGAVGAAVAGWLLAFSGGYEGRLVTRHLWGGALLAVAMLAAVGLRPFCTSRFPFKVRALYPLVLATVVPLMVWTSHQGGQLTHGETYLSRHAPSSVRAWLEPDRPSSGVALATEGRQVAAATTTFYDARIGPILEANCVTCHRQEKHKADLRLDTYEHLLKGGENGPVIAHGNPERSELYRRITLPSDHEDFMPSEGKPPLREAEIELIRVWIAAGASADEPADAIAAAPVPVDDIPAVTALAPDYRPHLAAITDLEKRLGLDLVPLSAIPTDGIVLRTASAPARCDDAALAQLAPISEFIVEAELARTNVTDEGAANLASWTHLRRVDLSHTAVTAAGVGALARLPHLQTLNLTATQVQSAELDDLQRIGNVYLFEAGRATSLALDNEP